MEDETVTAEAETRTMGAGERLRHEREARGLTIEEVASETRIPLRHIETIEAGDYARLPARTYAIGFTRSYAKMLGLDPREMTEQVRYELSQIEPEEERSAKFEPGDPERVPGRGLVILSIVAIILLTVGIFSFFSAYVAPGASPGSLLGSGEEEPAQVAEAEAQPQADPNAIDPDGDVVFTAMEDGVWVRFYDGEGERLFEEQMAAGQKYTVPASAENPQIWTGRPDAFTITVGGRSIPRLAEEDFVMRDVGVSGQALLDRQAEIDGEGATDGGPGEDAAPEVARAEQGNPPQR